MASPLTFQQSKVDGVRHSDPLRPITRPRTEVWLQHPYWGLDSGPTWVRRCCLHLWPTPPFYYKHVLYSLLCWPLHQLLLSPHGLASGPAKAIKAEAFPWHPCATLSMSMSSWGTWVGLKNVKCPPVKTCVLESLLSNICFLQSQENLTCLSRSDFTPPSHPWSLLPSWQEV